MTKFTTLFLAAATIITAQIGAAAGDEVPTLQIHKSCRTDVQAYPGGGGAAACLADEQRARETLASQWTQFASESRAKCTQMVTDIAGAQSYVESLTCLQVAKDAKTLPKD
jgi:hypothetical protein